MSDIFPYELIRSSRKTLSLQIREDGTLVVRAPRRLSKADIQQFIQEKRTWILENQEKARTRHQQILAQQEHQPQWSAADYEKAYRLALQVFQQKTALYANIMQVTYGRITVRDQKTRWGSCSAKGNLNFNWRLVLAPEAVLDYVVIHELAHRREMNHSPRFWELVETVMPDYKIHRRWRKENGPGLMSR